MKKANSTILVTSSTGITFTSDDYLITQGSLILWYCGAPGPKHLRDPRFRISINQINLQVIFRQNPNASKLCSVVASDESFVTFLYINELYRKKAVFFTNRKCFFLHIGAGNILAFMENNAKIKKQGIFIFFPET